MNKDPVFSVAVGGRQVYTGRWRWGDSGRMEQAARLFRYARNALTDLDRLKTTLEAEGRLTRLGLQDALAEQGRAFLSQSRAWRAEILAGQRGRAVRDMESLAAVQPRDAGDLAGVLADREIRDWFRALDGEARSRMVAGALAGASPEITAALVRMPPEITGLGPEAHARLRTTATPPENRPEMEELRELIAAIDTADRALEVAAHEIRKMAGLESEPVAGEARSIPPPAPGDAAGNGSQ